MRSPREKDVIILVSMSLKDRKQALYDLMAHLVHCMHTHARSNTKTCTDKDELDWTATKEIVFHISDTTIVCRLPVTAHCKNNYKTRKHV